MDIFDLSIPRKRGQYDGMYTDTIPFFEASLRRFEKHSGPAKRSPAAYLVGWIEARHGTEKADMGEYYWDIYTQATEVLK